MKLEEENTEFGVTDVGCKLGEFEFHAFRRFFIFTLPFQSDRDDPAPSEDEESKVLSKEEEELKEKEMEEWEKQMKELIAHHEQILSHFYFKHEWFYTYAKLTDVSNLNFVFTLPSIPT